MTDRPPDAHRKLGAPPIFGPAEDWHLNACMPGHYWDKWSAYTRGYKLAADLLVKLILEGRTEAVIDTLVMPIVFNYRQYIELSLKLLIIQLNMINHKHKPYEIPATHKLKHLWQKARDGLRTADVTEPSESFETISRVVSEFMQYDPGSSFFRYPVDKNGKLVLEDLKHINIRQLRKAMQMLDDAFQPIDYQVGYFLNALAEGE